MNKIKIILFLLFQIILILSCKSKNLYKNNEVGFSFNVPEDCLLDTEDKGLNNYYIRIYIYKPEDMLDGVEQFNNIKNKIENSEFPDIPNIPTSLIKYGKIGNIKVGIDFHMGYDIFDGVIGKRIFFIKNNKLVTIYLQYEFVGPKSTQDIENIKIKYQNIESKYYKKAKDEGINKNLDSYVINKIEKYIKANKGKKTEIPQEISELFFKFDELVASLKFTK